MFKVADMKSTFVVELSTKGKTRLVAFRSDEERALTVGSDIRADFRVSGAGVRRGAAIQFHLERRDGMAWLVPAYGVADLRVNTARVVGPLPLEERNVIEFGEARIDVAVFDGGTNNDAAERSAGSDRTWELDAPRTSEPPSEADTTLLAMRATPRPTDGIGQQITAMERPAEARLFGPQQTVRMAPYQSPEAAPSPTPAQSTERMFAVRNGARDCGPNGTEVMAPYRPNVIEEPDAGSPTVRARQQVSATADAPPIMSPAIVPRPVIPIVCASAAPRKASTPLPAQTPDNNARAFETHAPRIEQAPAAESVPHFRAPPLDAGVSASPGWSNGDKASELGKTPILAKFHSWLEKLGLLAMARPVLVACGATAGALVLGTALLVVTGLASHRETTCIATTSSPCGTQVGSQPQAEVFDVELSVRDDNGSPLAGATWTTSDTALGETGADGALRLTLRGREGQAMRAAFSCPAGYVASDTVSEIGLVHAQGISGKHARQVKVDAVCSRTTRDISVILHAKNGSFLPLLVDDKPVGATDADGNASVVLHVDRSARKLGVVLDTSARPDLTPKSPARSFELDGRDGVLVLAETLSRREVVKAKARGHAQCVTCRTK